MSPREKKLLLFFASAGFLVINFLLFGFFQNKRTAVDRGLQEAKAKLSNAEMISASREEVADEMDWLFEHEPEPAEEQDMQTKLQQLCEKEARNTGLTINTQKPLPTDATEGRHYHRAKFQCAVTGAEDALYRWFNAINMPDQLRVTTQVKMSPNKTDDTKIDCTAIVEQWFIPSTGEETSDESPPEEGAPAEDESGGEDQ